MRVAGSRINSKQKGASFERDVCCKLSLWITAGVSKDCFWRSAMSGGRSTVIVRAGGTNRQAGDITAVAPEGHILTDRYFIECKHMKTLEFAQFAIHDRGLLAGFWRKAVEQAAQHSRRPMLIGRQNRAATIVLTYDALRGLEPIVRTRSAGPTTYVYLFDELLQVDPKVCLR